MADATTPKPSRRKMSTPRRAAATSWPRSPTRSNRQGSGAVSRPEPVTIRVRLSSALSRRKWAQKMVARQDRQPQPEHALPGEGELRHDVDEAFGGEFQLELIPVGRHRPFRLEHDAQPRIGVDDPHRPPLPVPDLLRGDNAKPGRRGKRSVHQRSFKARKREAGHGNSACRRRKPIPPWRLRRDLACDVSC